MADIFNRVKVSTTTTGTGTITLGSPFVGYQSFSDGGATNGDTVRYVIEDGDNWEIGEGTYSTTGPTITRTVLDSSNAGSAISLTGSARVFSAFAVEDITTPGSDPTFNSATITTTLEASNISDGTTSVGTEYVVNGSAKSWVNFNGTGTIATRDSSNVASLTDNGTGNYTVTLTNAMANSDYCLSTNHDNSASTLLNIVSQVNMNPASGSFTLGTMGASALVDSELVMAQATGDLA